MERRRDTDAAWVRWLRGAGLAILACSIFALGCAIGMNQAAETKVEEFKLEIARLNKNLEEYKKEVQGLADALDRIARYLRKFWVEIHPEEK